MSKPTREQFLEQVVAVVTRLYPDSSLERDDGAFSLRVDGCTIPLENLYRLAADAPHQLEEHVGTWIGELLKAVKAVPKLDDGFEELRSRILPMVLPPSNAQVPEREMVRQSIIDGLDVAYALDAERTISYIPRRIFEQWGMDIDELHEIAIQNLVERSEQIEAQADQGEDGTVRLIVIQTLDGYDASRVLLPSLHERLSEHLGSPFVAGIPNRDILLCFRSDKEVVGRLQKQVHEMHQNMPHQVSDRLVLVTPDGIAPYSPD